MIDITIGCAIRTLPPAGTLFGDSPATGRLLSVDEKDGIVIGFGGKPMLYYCDGRAKAISAAGWRIHPDDLARFAAYFRALAVERARGPFLLFCMLNPSKAAAELNDPTVTRCAGFAARERMTGGLPGAVPAGIDSTYRYLLSRPGFEVVNHYGYRMTDPGELVRAAKDGIDVIGPDNDATIADAAARCIAIGGRIVYAPGSRINMGPKAHAPTFRGRAEAVLRILTAAGDVYRFHATCGRGETPHPLMLAKDTPLVLYRKRATEAANG